MADIITPITSDLAAKDVSVKPATLADVAKLAGVVPMTASRAINGTGYVSNDVRRRVEKAAAALNYRPNMLARSLKGQRLNAVGIMLPDIANPYSSELVAGIQAVLDNTGYTAFLATANHSAEHEKAALLAFVDHRVAGIIVATRGTQVGDETIASITRQGVPVLAVGRPIMDAVVDCVTADDFTGTRLAVEHLIERGHRRIGFVGVSPRHAQSLRRYQGYVAALEAHGIEVSSELVAGSTKGPSNATEQDGYEAMLRLGKPKHRPTAVFVRNDYAAIGALRAAQELGLSVPGDLAVASFDNTPVSAYTSPPLTTVAQPIKEQGNRAAEFLLDRIEGRETGPRRELCLDCHLVVRKSTGALERV